MAKNSGKSNEDTIEPISVRSHLSAGQILAAVHMAHSANFYEQEFNRGNPVEPNAASHYHGQVMGAIFLAVATMESYINEIFSDADDGGFNPLHWLNPHQIDLLARMWRRGIPRTSRYPILEKYQITLELLSYATFDEGRNPYQDAQLVIQLRNSLVHYEPETLILRLPEEVNHDNLHNLEKKLHNKFSSRPQREGISSTWWPYQCLCAECAKWAATTAISLITSMNERTGGTEFDSRHLKDIQFDF